MSEDEIDNKYVSMWWAILVVEAKLDVIIEHMKIDPPRDLNNIPLRIRRKK